MPSERRRHQLYEEVKQVLSQDSADELMSYLPPVGWADVATKDDLAMSRNETDALRAELRGEMAELRSELRGEMAELRSELRGEMAELRGEMAELRSELRGEMAELRGEMAELRADMDRRFASFQRWTITTLIAMTGVLGALVVGANHLGR